MRASTTFASITQLTVFAAAALLITAGAGEARHDRASGYQDGMTIEAVSRHGNGSQLGVVRSARYGWEVRLPRGTWVSCRRSCEETLRVQTVDIFENQDGPAGYGDTQNECGVFGCLDITYPR